MNKSTHSWLKLALTGSALIYGGPAAAAIAGLLASKEVQELLAHIFGQKVEEILSHGPAGLEHAVPHVAAHFLCEKLHDFSHHESPGLNHDLRRGFVHALAFLLNHQVRSLIYEDERDDTAWTSNFDRARFLSQWNELKPHFEGLYSAWIERLESALQNPEKLDTLFPTAAPGSLPVEARELDKALAEAAAYTASDSTQPAQVWFDLFDQILAPESSEPLPSQQSAATPSRFRPWNILKLRAAKKTEEERVREHFTVLVAAGYDLRSEVARYLHARFPSAFAEVLKSDEFKKTWIAYLKLTTEITRDTVLNIKQTLTELRQDQRSEFSALEKRLDELLARPNGLETIAFSTTNLIDAIGQSEQRLEEVLRNEFRRTSALLETLDRKLDYAIAGLPIQPFKTPDPPVRELELLQARHRAVALTGRDADLKALFQWLLTADPISARLLVGQAGTGKTRLALELLLRVSVELPAWQAGIVTGTILRRFNATKQPLDWRWSAPTLIVLDYAQTLGEPLTDLLKALTFKRDEKLPPLRILLLERQSGDWFDTLLRQEESTAPCSVRALFDPPSPVSIATLPEGELRRFILSQTLTRAAALQHKPALRLPDSGNESFETSLARDIFNQPLNLMLAAIAATELGLSPALERSRIQLAEVLAQRELMRVERFARDHQSPAQKRALRHLAGCAALERGFTTEELRRAVEEELAALKIIWPEGSGTWKNCCTRPSVATDSPSLQSSPISSAKHYFCSP